MASLNVTKCHSFVFQCHSLVFIVQSVWFLFWGWTAFTILAMFSVLLFVYHRWRPDKSLSVKPCKSCRIKILRGRTNTCSIQRLHVLCRWGHLFHILRKVQGAPKGPAVGCEHLAICNFCFSHRKRRCLQETVSGSQIPGFYGNFSCLCISSPNEGSLPLPIVYLFLVF